MVASNSTLVFKVRRSEPELVHPARPTPIEVKSLSIADDTKIHRHHLSCILFYPASPDMEGKDAAKVIKVALAEALVYYYPWAGRLKGAPDGSLVVDCTAEGVGFVEADADVRLEEFGDESLQPPFPCIGELVYNKATTMKQIVGCPLFAMQVTRLLCGGFILTFTFNHVMSDVRGACQLLTAITDLARGATTPSVPPSWHRELLGTAVHPSADADQPEEDDTTGSVYRSFFFGPREVDALRSLIPAGHLRDSCSTFDLIAASVFRSRTIALQPRPEEEKALLGFIVDARRKLALPESFYGNACVPAVFVCSAAEVCRVGSLAYLVEQVKKAKEKVTEDYARSMWAMRGDPPIIPAAIALDVIFSDLSRAGLSSLDFGWGEPVHAGTTDNSLNPHLLTFIVASRNGRLVTLCLPADAMDRFSMALQSLTQGGVQLQDA